MAFFVTAIRSPQSSVQRDDLYKKKSVRSRLDVAAQDWVEVSLLSCAVAPLRQAVAVRRLCALLRQLQFCVKAVAVAVAVDVLY